jgi:ribosome biogenesis GTPase / thiamine phosphate phosphatase
MSDRRDAPRLRDLGWNAELAGDLAASGRADPRPGRVAIDFGTEFLVLTEEGEERARLSEALHSDARGGDRVVVGDWVALQDGGGDAEIVARLPRRSFLSRIRPGTGEKREQVIAANIDTAFLVTDALDLSAGRMERYLSLVREGHANPVIVVTKLDRDRELGDQAEHLPAVAEGVPVHTVSSATGEGLGELEQYLEPGRTVCLLGSSGVGKSTLVNRFLGHEQLKSQETRPDGQGRHTTSHRELVLLPSGAILIDNPGMREIGLWEVEDNAPETFADVYALAEGCRFRDCSHRSEPGCAVREAVRSGRLRRERLESFQKHAGGL